MVIPSLGAHILPNSARVGARQNGKCRLAIARGEMAAFCHEHYLEPMQESAVAFLVQEIR